MDVEFVTDRDTDDALLVWFAKNRRELLSTMTFVSVSGILVYVVARSTWSGTSLHSLAFVASMLFLLAGIGIMAVSRDPDRTPLLPFPQTDVLSVGLVVVAAMVAFEHHPTILTFMLLSLAITVFALVIVRFPSLFPILRDLLPASAHAVHVRIDAEGTEHTVRPHDARRIPWKSVRSMECDGRLLVIGVGLSTVIIPRRAFPNDARWQEFIGYARSRAAELQNRPKAPISKHGLFPARSASVAPHPFDPSHNPRRGVRRRTHRAPSGR
jgi:hypothetical protein